MQNADRVAALGNWPKRMKGMDLLKRIPDRNDTQAKGFDAGIACALDIIPEKYQQMPAQLHANYTPDIVQQAKEQIAKLLQASEDDESVANLEATWWLSMSLLCHEGHIDQAAFLQQVADARKLVDDPAKRIRDAKEKYHIIQRLVEINTDIDDTIPYGNKDGAIQGAYLLGFPVAVSYNEKLGYYIGTYLPSLGLEDFDYAGEGEAVEKSTQFVNLKTKEKLKAALAVVKTHLADKLPSPETLISNK